MLVLNQRRKWVELPGEPGVRLLLSPLPMSRRAVLTEQCVVLPGKAEKGKPRRAEYFDHARYVQAVGAECLHGWDGVFGVDDAGHRAPAAFTPELRQQLLEIDPVSAFLLTTVTGLGIHLQEEEAQAGNASAGAPAG